MTREREEVIKTAWRERGIFAWRAERHGRGLEPLWIPASADMKPESPRRRPLVPAEQLEFRLEKATSSGRPYDAIVCEGVVVEKIERY